MTKRARIYLIIAGSRHFSIGVFLLVTPWLFGSAAFIPVFNLLPLAAWGIIMALTGIVAYVAAWARDADWARGAMVASAAITGMLAAGITIGVVTLWWTWIEAVGWHNFWTILLNPAPELPDKILPLAVIPPSPFLPILLIAVTFKDFVVCAQPLRSPFESVLRREQSRQPQAIR